MSVITAVVLTILMAVVALLLRARQVEHDRSLVCKVAPKLLFIGRTWKLRISNESTSVTTVGKVVVTASMAISVHAEQAVLNMGSIVLPPGGRAEFDLGPPLTQLLERLGRWGEGQAAMVLSVTIDIHYLVKSKRGKRTVRCIALCNHGGVAEVSPAGGNAKARFDGVVAPR